MSRINSNIMCWDTIHDKLEVLSSYQKFGLDCTSIMGIEGDEKSYKSPSSINISDADWEKATGIGIQLGGNNEIRAIDIDDFSIMVRDFNDSEHSTIHRLSETFFVKRCLSLLGLPEDYEWLIRTPHGWHIVFSAPAIGFPKLSVKPSKEYQPNVVSGSTVHFRLLELLWDGHLVMPPSSSIHIYNWYSFYNQTPQNAPARIDLAKVLDFVNYYCGTFEYTVDITDECLCPIVGDAHLFPNYTHKICWGSGDEIQMFMGEKLVEISNNTNFLKACRTPAGYNMLGVYLVKSELKENFRVEKNLATAIKCFNMANDAWGHYNLACLMAIGAMDGTLEDLYKHLNSAESFPENYKEQLVILYLAKNKSYEKYAIIDISTDSNQRIEKIAVLLTDRKGHVFYNWFIKENNCLLENMYHALEHADYIVGLNVNGVYDIVRNECEYSGTSFSYDSDSAIGVVHCEGNYLDVLKRPCINLEPLDNDEETDPFRHVYILKEQMVQYLDSKK